MHQVFSVEVRWPATRCRAIFESIRGFGKEGPNSEGVDRSHPQSGMGFEERSYPLPSHEV